MNKFLYRDENGTMSRNLLIIDGHNFLFKAYGVPFKFHSKNGTPLHVVTTFLSLTRRALSVSKFTDIAIVFDTDTRNSNHELSDTYKATRKQDYSADEDSPFRHLPRIKECLSFLKIKTFEKKGIEADDLIASLTDQYLKQYRNSNVFIASSDSDFYQLLSKKVSMVTLKSKGMNELFTKDSLKEKYDILPEQYVLFKSLTGDTADNIKGIPGVGPIRASKIINKLIPFDEVVHKDLLAHNSKLILLNKKIKTCKSWDVLNLNPKINILKNPEIFLKLKF